MEREEGTSAFRASSHTTRLSKYVSRLTRSEATDAAVISSMEELLSFAMGTGTIGYYFPEIARDVDPDGHLIPVLAAKQIGDERDLKIVRRYSRIAGAYPTGKDSWRSIALAALAANRDLSGRDHISIFSTLCRRGVRSLSAPVGEVPQELETEAGDARRRLEAEPDALLIPYWTWKREIAEAELQEAEENAKEERGE